MCNIDGKTIIDDIKFINMVKIAMHYESYICTGCSCLCDDIIVDVNNNNIEKLINICSLGKKKVSPEEGTRIQRPMIRNNELQGVELDRALKKSAELLSQAKRPMVYGLGNISYEAQAKALEIAKKIGALFSNNELLNLHSFYSEMKNQSVHLAIMEEIRDYSDTVLFWRCNPHLTNPRHLARFSIFPRGRYIERGYEDRVVITIDREETEMGHFSRFFLKMGDNPDYTILEGLIKGINGESINNTEINPKTLKNIADQLVKSSHGVIFFDPRLSAYPDGKKNMEYLFSLVKSLNCNNQFVISPLIEHYNTQGLIELLLRETGYPLTGCFSKNGVYQPDEEGNMNTLDGVDAILIAGADPALSFPPDEIEKLKNIPIILLEPFETSTMSLADVVFPTAITGIESDGIAYRIDGIPFRVNKIVTNEYFSDLEILEGISKYI